VSETVPPGGRPGYPAPKWTFGVAVVYGGGCRGRSSETYPCAPGPGPFWDRTLGEWVDAANLVAGHQLRTLDGDVLAAGEPVLVHNCDPEIQDLGSMTGSGQTNLWDMSSNDRGLAFEREMGMSNLPDGFKTFDHLESDSGIAISVKSVDTRKLSTKTNTGFSMSFCTPIL